MLARRGLSNETTLKRFKKWMQDNCLNEDDLDGIDIEAEFGKDLSYSEAIELALHKFPSMWREDSVERYENKPKQIIFVKDLVQKIIAGQVQVTYRKTPKVGMYYVIENRFKQKSDTAKLLIEFYQTDRVDPYNLSDEEANLAGVENAEKIRELFVKWYGSPLPSLYRNWFKVKELQNA
ncbi:MAG: hypothetical protein JRN52_02710 [Nitrososphaerota archaeon]|nr:hypothetical protein [Nitrososphaerota archaeon]